VSRRARATLVFTFLLLAGGCGDRGELQFDPATFTAGTPEVSAIREAAWGANVVICVIDAARADHIGCYGYPRATTPNMDRLAEQSFVFRHHFCQYPSTKPSTASLFTSQYSDTHLALEGRRFLEGTFTLAQGFERAGFRTVLFSSNPNASPAMGIGLDFQKVYDQRDVEPLVSNWEKFTLPQPLLTLIEAWLDKNGDSRFLAYVHFDPPHQPYLQPEEMTRLFAGKRPPGFERGAFEFPVGDEKLLSTCNHPPLPEWINLYDANLRFADWAVGEVERLLRSAGVFDNTVFVVSADHGEAFGEHGYLWHERGVYDELVHIPLLMRLPGGKLAGDVEGLTESIDLLPTLCDMLEVPYPREGIQGKSLLRAMAGLEEEVRGHVFCRSDGRPPSYLMRGKEWALVLYGNGEWRALYDLAADPGQRQNVIAENPDAADAMLAGFREFALQQRRPPVDFLSPEVEMPPLPEAGETALTPEMQRQLRALGYVK